MKSEYPEEDYLQLSGIQHFVFCRRQWALIHIEGLWADNDLTLEGDYLHERAHDPKLDGMAKGAFVSRAMPVRSRRLGLSGACEVVEFIPAEDGVPLAGKAGLFRPYPICAPRRSALRRCSAFGLNGATSTTMRSGGECRSCCLPNCESGFARCRRRCTISLQRVSLPPPMPPGSATSVPSRISACRS